MKIADQQQEHAEPARGCAHEYGSRGGARPVPLTGSKAADNKGAVC